MARSESLKSAVILWVGVGCLGIYSIGLNAAASESHYEQPSTMAVGLFNQGYRHCQAAHRQRGRDVSAARRKFQLYLDYLEQAVAEDPRVTSTKANNIDRNIAYCNQVAEDLTRALATPYLEKSYVSCKTAKQFLAEFDVANAEKYFRAHKQLKDKALNMSPDLLSRALNQTWTQEGERLCKRVKLNIKRLGNRLARINLDIPVVQSHLDTAVSQCSAARKMVSENGPVVKLEALLMSVKRANGKAREFGAVWEYAETASDEVNPLPLTKSLASSRWCEQRLSKEIAALVVRNQHQALKLAQETLPLQEENVRVPSQGNPAVPPSMPEGSPVLEYSLVINGLNLAASSDVASGEGVTGERGVALDFGISSKQGHFLSRELGVQEAPSHGGGEDAHDFELEYGVTGGAKLGNAAAEKAPSTTSAARRQGQLEVESASELAAMDSSVVAQHSSELSAGR